VSTPIFTIPPEICAVAMFTALSKTQNEISFTEGFKFLKIMLGQTRPFNVCVLQLCDVCTAPATPIFEFYPSRHGAVR